jgi:ElaB/YqjD/DUF883 family membrane-anchored ribosome-binding protein
MNIPEQHSPTQEQLIGDLRLVIENAEALLQNTGQYSGGMYHGAREKLAEARDVANSELEGFEEAQLARMLEATAQANQLHQDKTGEARIMRAFH